MSRAFGRCKHCGETLWEPDFSTCSHCACLTAGRWVSSPDGPGEIVQVRHSGGLVVNVDGLGTRQYRGGQLAVIATPPAPIREPELAPAPIAPAVAEPPIVADHTSDCRPLCDPDPLARIRREILSRPFPAWALMPQPR